MSDTKKKVTVIVPVKVFAEIFQKIMGSRECNHHGCRYIRADCRLESMIILLHTWWKEANGTAPGFSCYQEMVSSSIRDTDQLYEYMFVGHRVAEDVHRTIKERVTEIFRTKQVA